MAMLVITRWYHFRIYLYIVGAFPRGADVWGHDLDLFVQPVGLVTFGDMATVQSVDVLRYSSVNHLYIRTECIYIYISDNDTHTYSYTCFSLKL
jgi:hypothetical protein